MQSSAHSPAHHSDGGYGLLAGGLERALFEAPAMYPLRVRATSPGGSFTRTETRRNPARPGLAVYASQYWVRNSLPICS